MRQYPICSQCCFDYCSLTNTRYFTRFGKINLLLSYRNFIPRSSSGAHNGAKISICINNQKFESFKTPATVWMDLPVSRVGDAASLGIWLLTLRGVPSYEEHLRPSRRDHHTPSNYRDASKINLVTTYYNLSVAVYFTTMAVNEVIRRRGEVIYKHVRL
jgi:hypothetical protein